MVRLRVVHGIVLFVMLLALIGCVGTSSPVSRQAPQHGAALPGALASLALPDDRQAAGLTETLIPGKFTLSRSAGALDNGTALELDATASGLEWGIYGFTPGMHSLDTLAVQLDAVVGNQVWIGLGNYTRNAWEWYGPFNAGKVLAIDSSRYLSPGGLFTAAVVAAGHNSATVDALSIRTINPQNQPPVAALNADVLSGDAPLTVHLDAGDSSDPDGQIVEYAWDFDGDGWYDSISDQAGGARVFATPGVYTVRVRVTDDQFARDTAEVEINVTAVGNNSPMADLQPPMATGDAPLTVYFNASGSNAGGDAGDSIVKYEWDFDGDGIFDGYGQSATVSHVYTQPGVYAAKVRVTDSAGNQAADTSTVNVNTPGNSAPVADLQPPTASGNAPYTVNFNAGGSSDSDGTIVKYEWDFDGDGNYDGYGADATISHTYTTAGVFTAKLRVTDDDSAQSTDASSITVNVPGNSSPTASLSATPVSGDAPLDVDFDAGASHDSDGTIVRYDWDLDGDGNYEFYDGGATPSHTYATAGVFTARLRVTDDDGAQATDTTSITVNVPGNSSPTASLSASPVSGDTPLSVDFDASASSDSDGTIVRYDWDLDGDGNYEYYDGGATPSHTYTAAGVFTARLRVMDDDGAQATDTTSITVNVPGNSAPTADLDADRTACYAPFVIHFDASDSSDSDGTIALYEWDFDGDGSYEEYGTTAALAYTYPQRGVYYAQVRVTDNDGAQDTAQLVITLPSAWPMVAMDAMHSGRSPYTGAQTAAVKWSYSTSNTVHSSPAVGADGTVYVGCYDHKLLAIQSNGTLKWAYLTGSLVGSSPAIGADGTVYVGSMDSKLYALNQDSTLKWSYTTGDMVNSSPAIGADGTVYVGSKDCKLYAINPDGTLKWSYTTDEVVFSSPAIGADGTVYIGSMDNKLYAIKQNGSLKWSYTTGGAIPTSPAIGADGTVYIGDNDYNLYAINPDGTLKWSYATGYRMHSTPAIGADGTVYVGSDDNKLYALNPDGSLKWSYTTGGDVASSPAIGADGTVYVGSNDNKLYALNPDGTLKWSYTTGDDVASSPAIGADGTVYVGSVDYKLYAFGT
jgi:outer membrane protein assembly factor BamB